jgi:hypothetical protein
MNRRTGHIRRVKTKRRYHDRRGEVNHSSAAQSVPFKEGTKEDYRVALTRTQERFERLWALHIHTLARADALQTECDTLYLQLSQLKLKFHAADRAVRMALKHTKVKVRHPEFQEALTAYDRLC